VMKPVREAMFKEKHELADIMNVMDFTIRKCVKMALRIPYFNSMTNASQYQLLKTSMISMLTVRGVARLNEGHEGFCSPILFGDKVISIKELFDRLSAHEQKEKLMKFYDAIDLSARKDPTAIWLLGMIAMFYGHEAVVNEKDRQHCNTCYEGYLILLKRYLESKFHEGGARVMNTILAALDQLSGISKVAAMLFANKVKTDGKKVSALSSEFFPTETKKS